MHSSKEKFKSLYLYFIYSYAVQGMDIPCAAVRILFSVPLQQTQKNLTGTTHTGAIEMNINCTRRRYLAA